MYKSGTVTAYRFRAVSESYSGRVRLNCVPPFPLQGLLQMTLNGAFLAKNGPVFQQIKKDECGSTMQRPACKAVFKLVNGGFPIEMNKVGDFRQGEIKLLDHSK